ncbi:hypothetical protein JOE32_004551 [Pseudomonas sp. PvP025]|nr:hypothetical protein [Pseudomonas sp. PvP025]MDQ0397022.1 hypothetical protein [Pseudomonas sp. PvP006]
MRVKNVGGGLLPKAVFQSVQRRLNYRYREQAPSHIERILQNLKHCAEKAHYENSGPFFLLKNQAGSGATRCCAFPWASAQFSGKLM